MTSRSSRRCARGLVRRPFTTTMLVAALLVGATATSCSSDGDDSSAVLDQVAPTKADIANEAGIDFPPSTAGFRLVRIGAGQIDVSFTLDPADVAAFADGSGIELTDGERAITHASPLWDVAVQGEVAGGSSTRDGVNRSAEVVVEDGVTTIRLSVTQA